jgi:hypothetical protein
MSLARLRGQFGCLVKVITYLPNRQVPSAGLRQGDWLRSLSDVVARPVEN